MQDPARDVDEAVPDLPPSPLFCCAASNNLPTNAGALACSPMRSHPFCRPALTLEQTCPEPFSVCFGRTPITWRGPGMPAGHARRPGAAHQAHPRQTLIKPCYLSNWLAENARRVRANMHMHIDLHSLSKLHLSGCAARPNWQVRACPPSSTKSHSNIHTSAA